MPHEAAGERLPVDAICPNNAPQKIAQVVIRATDASTELSWSRAITAKRFRCRRRGLFRCPAIACQAGF